jgi:hypothetical protein
MPDGANMLTFPTPEAQPPKQDSSCLPLRPNIVAFSRHFSLAQGDVAGAHALQKVLQKVLPVLRAGTQRARRVAGPVLPIQTPASAPCIIT